MPPLFPSRPTPVRILIVDDDPGYAGGLSAILSGNPRLLVVGRAADGQEGVELARRLRPDVVVMDVNMPRLDGFAATRAIRGDFPQMRIVIVSGERAPEHLARAREVGADLYLPKACDFRELEDVVLGERVSTAGATFALAFAI